TAVIGRGAVWNEPVAIGPYAVLGEGVRLGKGVRVGAACVLGDGVQVGDDVRLHPQVVCYSGTIIGHRVILHAGARLGSDGFGYIPGRGGELPRKVPQIGRCIIGDDVEIGANTTIDRGSVDDTVIGAGTKIDNLVQIGHNCRIGARCLIAGQAGIAGSTHVEDDVFLPAPPGQGIVFRRTDLTGTPVVPARLTEVEAVERRTAIGKGRTTIHTVEHLLAAVAAHEIDDLTVELTGPEPPILDGSVQPYFEA